jgi:hypothetical protein
MARAFMCIAAREAALVRLVSFAMDCRVRPGNDELTVQ